MNIIVSAVVLILLILVVSLVCSINPEGAKFLAENAKGNGVVVRPSGLQYKVIKSGTGLFHPSKQSLCRCHYTGRLIDGTVFDSSHTRNRPGRFVPSELIEGWAEAIQLMVEGDEWEIYIPSELGYGDNGRAPKIQGGDVLIFRLELLKVKGDKRPSAACDPTLDMCNPTSETESWNRWWSHIATIASGFILIVAYFRNVDITSPKVSLSKPIRLGIDWKQKYFGQQISRKSGLEVTNVVLKNKSLVCLFFSAHWCEPSREFLPLLLEFYERVNKIDPDRLEIVFVSHDYNSDAFHRHFEDMPWVAVPFSNARDRKDLSRLFEVRVLPCCIILDGSAGEIRDLNGKSTILSSMSTKGKVSMALKAWSRR